MSYTLVVVESPGKIKKMESILGLGYKVTATVGMIKALDPKKISVDTKDGKFTPNLVIMDEKKKTVNSIKSLFSSSNGNLIIATDIDRVGESIGNDLLEILNVDKTKKNRLFFTSITENEIKNGMKNLRHVNQSMVTAELTRKVIDRLIGYPVSDIVRKKTFIRNLSAGRVQSPVAKLIVEKEREIESKKNIPYFVISIDKERKLLLKKKSSVLKLNEKDAIDMLEKLSKKTFVVKNIKTIKKKVNPPKPLTTSTLQQMANKKFGFPPTRTMASAQKLYESGLITYHRTDSSTLSSYAHKSLKNHITKTYGEKSYKRRDASNGNNIQGAHECIRPSNITLSTITTKGNISFNEVKLYNMIYSMTISSQMESASYDVYEIEYSGASDKTPDCYFSKRIEILVTPGYLLCLDSKKKKEDKKIPKIGDPFGNVFLTALETEDPLPQRYTQGSLIKRLDPADLNIGRPSTYSTIIETIIKKNYVEEVNMTQKQKKRKIYKYLSSELIPDVEEYYSGETGKKLIPTMLGKKVVDFLEINFPKIMDYKYTASMEQNLDLIIENKKSYLDVVTEIFSYTNSIILILKKEKKVAQNIIRNIGKHPETGNNILIKLSSKGLYLQVENEKRSCPINDKEMDHTKLTIEDALVMLEFPKMVGEYKGNQVFIKKGKHGIYLEHGVIKCNYPDHLSEYTLEEAISILDKNKHWTNGNKIYTIHSGKYGPYVKVTEGKKITNISLKIPEENVSLEYLIKLEEEKKNKPATKRFVPGKFSKWKKKN